MTWFLVPTYTQKICGEYFYYIVGILGSLEKCFVVRKDLFMVKLSSTFTLLVKQIFHGE